jgi:hypothetical protein
LPFIYTTQSQMQSATYSTSGSLNTEIDVFSVKPGTANTVSILAIRAQGRGAGLTALSGIELNVKNWTTASTGGTTLTPSPNDVRNGVAAGHVPRIGTGGGVNPVAQGSGGGTYRSGFGFGASGPGGWVAANPDASLTMVGGYAGSLDLYSISGTASLLYSFWVEAQE